MRQEDFFLNIRSAVAANEQTTASNAISAPASHISGLARNSTSAAEEADGACKIIFGNCVDLDCIGIPPISATNAEMDGAREPTVKAKML